MRRAIPAWSRTGNGMNRVPPKFMPSYKGGKRVPSFAYRARAIRVPCTQPTSNRSLAWAAASVTKETSTTADANHSATFKIRRRNRGEREVGPFVDRRMGG